MSAGNTSARPETCSTAIGQAQARQTTKTDLERTVRQVAERIPYGRLASAPARHSFRAGRVQLLGVIRVGIKRSAAEVLHEEIALGPELLQTERPEHTRNRVQSPASAEHVAPVRVRRFAHLK